MPSDGLEELKLPSFPAGGLPWLLLALVMVWLPRVAGQGAVAESGAPLGGAATLLRWMRAFNFCRSKAVRYIEAHWFDSKVGTTVLLYIDFRQS